MKIVYLHQYFKFPTESGGTRSYDLATGFLKKDYVVEVITSTSDISLKSKKKWLSINKDGLIVHYIYLPYGNHLSYFKRAIVFFQFLWYASFKLLSIKCDTVLATSTPLTIAIPALFKKWRHNTPFIFETRDVWPEAVIAIGAIKNNGMKKLLFFLEKIIYKNATAIVPLSVDMKKSIVSRYPSLANQKSIEVIENIAEINRFQNDFSNETAILKNTIGFQPRFSVLYAGTFGRVNGIDYVVNLAEKTLPLDDSIVYILIGAGALKKEVKALAAEKKVLNKNLFILDAISKQELPQWYFEASMGSSFVIPIQELWANSANKFFDTLAAGKPILINHPGWQKETIEKENVGYVLPKVLTDNKVKEFVKYTQDTGLIKEQQTNALKLGINRYSLKLAVEKYTRLFDIIRK
ncbi:glycosyltransferase family 4 protein [Mesonia aestuariivivens]|uniref:Glycosyltransferase family 4 protein n=1 Tax=Mesonia aestuariivivens TaxID=2796128 RepID=A0ABS6W4V7_9FLAO|nr:glycosyltransferase family 4 protein [Mesonia aestuariivivens]MBW2962896.1 glycosyltransferase family 4 protein [Mesonia aestuariivivens]